MDKKEEKLELIIESLGKIYVLDAQKKEHTYMDLKSQPESELDKIIQSLVIFFENEKINNREIVHGFEKMKNTLKESGESLIEQSELNINL